MSGLDFHASWRLPATLDQSGPLVDLAIAFLQENAPPGAWPWDDLRLALGEALVNAAKHGAAGQWMGLAVGPWDEQGLRLQVRDEGPPWPWPEAIRFPEPEALAESGYGLALIQALLVDPVLRREGDANLLEARWPPPPEATA